MTEKSYIQQWNKLRSEKKTHSEKQRQNFKHKSFDQKPYAMTDNVLAELKR